MRRTPLSLFAFMFVASIAAGDLPSPQNLRLLNIGEGEARLRWDTVDDPALKGYRLKYSLTPGVHPDMTDWNGHEAAFTFTTDDGSRTTWSGWMFSTLTTAIS